MAGVLIPLAVSAAVWDDEALRVQRQTLNYAYVPIQDDPEASAGLQRHLERTFGLKPYKANYYLPVSYADRPYPVYDPADRYRQLEAEYQYSISIDLFADVLHWGELYGVAMTSRGFWQMYSPSSPFREVNYNPEVYALFPVSGWIDGLKTLTLTYSHASNGQGDIETADINRSDCSGCYPYWQRSRSRAWNYVSAVLGLQYGALLIDLTLRVKIDVRMFEIKDDNPDIMDYYGWTRLNAAYLLGAHRFEAMGRLNPVTGYGAFEAGWSYPFFGRESVFWYAKGFCGYGESLIDYDRYVNKVGFGFSFFR